MEVNKIKNTLISSFFNKKDIITGKEILTFCDEKQINMFVIFLLMKEWKNEVENMKSPYFDFTSKEVKEALKTYMNTVSKNISINKNDFEPILEKAINYTFQLVENPESFLISNRLESDLNEITKYIIYHKPYFEGDKDYEVENLSQQVFEKLGINTQEENNDTLSSIHIEEEKVSINEKLSNSQNKSRIVDSFIMEDEENSVPLKKIENIKNAITINQKFIFVNELFNNQNENYNNFIERLDSCKDIEEANTLLNSSTEVGEDNEAFKQLTLLIKQKYNYTAE